MIELIGKNSSAAPQFFPLEKAAVQRGKHAHPSSQFCPCIENDREQAEKDDKASHQPKGRMNAVNRIAKTIQIYIIGKKIIGIGESKQIPVLQGIEKRDGMDKIITAIACRKKEGNYSIGNFIIRKDEKPKRKEGEKEKGRQKFAAQKDDEIFFHRHFYAAVPEAAHRLYQPADVSISP